MINIEQIVFEKAKKSDVEEIYNLEQVCFEADAFSKKQFKYLITKANSDFIVIRDKFKIIAYLIILKRRNSKYYRIYSIAIAPNARGFGLAKKLLGYTEEITIKDKARGIKLEVSEKNEAAINLYLSHKFQPVGKKDNYYADGSSAILMRKEI